MSKLFFILILLSAGGLLNAQEDSSAKSLNEVIITANRFPQKQNTTGKVVTVIDRSVIEKNSGRSLSELLIQQAGITIIGANNTPGTNQDVYMRGAATGNVLILIDGVPAYDPSNISSTFDINHLALEQYERIEILKGAQSTVYGSDAVAGVINLISRKNAEIPVAGYLLAAGGSYDTYKLGAGLHGQKGKSAYQVQYQFLRSGGLSAAIDTTEKSNFDEDDFKQHTISANYQFRITDNIEWRIYGQYGRYRYGLDASAFTDDRDSRGDNENYQAGTGLKWKYKQGLVQANYNLNTSTRNYVDDSTSVGGFAKYSIQDYTGKASFAELYVNHHFSEQLNVLAGTDFRWQQTDQYFYSLSDFGPYETQLSGDSAKSNIISGYASAFLRLKNKFNIESGVRYNYHSMFGNSTSFTFNPSFNWNRIKLFANVASAFKAPSLYQLYDASAGNAALNPEKSITVETGVSYRTLNEKWQARVVFFHRNIKDGIEYSYISYKYFNNNEQKDYGVELESSYREKNWNFSLNYTFLTGKVNTVLYEYDPGNYSYIISGDTTYNNLFRRPKHQLNLTGGYQLTSHLYLSANARFTGKRYEPRFMETPLELSSYETIDIYGEYRIFKKITIFLNVNNIFDERYMDIRGYAPKGRNFMSGLKINL